MDEVQKQKMLVIGSACVMALAVLFIFAKSCGGDSYSRMELGLDSADTREAVALIEQLATAPEDVGEHMSETARANAVSAVQEAAEAMSELGNVAPVDAAWFGDYMRLTVACERENSAPLEMRFFLVREGGELRITGMQK